MKSEAERVFRIFARKKPAFAVEASALLSDIRTDLKIQGLKSLEMYHRYDVSGISDAEYLLAKPIVFSEPPVDDTFDEEIPVETACFVLGIESLPGQYDQRADSAAQCIQMLTKGERPAVRAAKIIAFYGNMSEADKSAVASYLINPVECRSASFAKPDSLADSWETPADIPVLEGFSCMSENELLALRSELGLAMSEADILFVGNFFREEGRDPTMTEIRVLDTYWSDHCRHTTFCTELTDIECPDSDHPFGRRVLEDLRQYKLDRQEIYGERLAQKPICLMDLATIAMKKLKAEGKLSDLDESEEINACSVKTTVKINGEDCEYVVMFKNETHNHPTEIEPFGGAATCIGGAIRDPLSGRSYVYQAMRVTGAADPLVPVSETLPGKLPQKKIVRTAAAGYSSYGNQIGLATGQVDEIYHPGYVAKRMEIGAVIAAAPAQNIVRKRPAAGDVILLVGGRTGRDGIGGATGSSKVHDETSVTTCGSEVQKGNAPTERKIQRLFRKPEVSQLIIRCNDFGAGGVSVAVGELADGLSIDLDAVMKKYEGLDGTEIAISESQERMAVTLHPQDEAAFLREVEAENLEATRIAVVTEAPRMVMSWRGRTVVDLPRSFIDTNGAPSYAKAKLAMPDMEKSYADEKTDGYVSGDFCLSLTGGLSSLGGCSRRGLTQRFDSTIGAATVLMPFGGKNQSSPEEGMVAKIPTEKGATDTATYMSYGYDPYYSSWSPYHGSYHAVVESLLKLAAMGADPEKAKLTFQEYFERMTSAEAWGKPFMALLGAYRAQTDFSVAAIGGKDSMSGNFQDLHVPPTLVSFAVGIGAAAETVSATIPNAGKTLWCISLKRDETGLYDVAHTKRVFREIRKLAARGQTLAAAVVRGSGIAVRAVQMTFGNGLGLQFNDALNEKTLFTRSFGSILLVPSEKNAVEKIEMLGGFRVGTTTDDGRICYKDKQLLSSEALNAYEGTLEPIFPILTETEKATGAETVPVEKPTNVKAPNTYKSGTSCPEPRVLIPVFPGTNCEDDTAHQFRLAGARPEIFVIRNQSSAAIAESLTELSKAVRRSQIMMFPGGFSAGDEPEGSGKFIAAVIRNSAITEAVTDLLQNRDGLILGICNGFQALIKLGLLPYGEIRPLAPTDPTLTFNRIGRHQSGYVSTRVVSVASPWFSMVTPGDIHRIPISHGEGRFVASEEMLGEFFARGQVATQYVDLQGVPSMSTLYNPNGSMSSIEGIFSPDGRVFGKMCHSERIGDYVGKNIPGEKDQKIFASGVRYFT